MGLCDFGALITGTQSTNLFGFPPFSIKHSQGSLSLHNVDWHPPKFKSAPSKKFLATSNPQFLNRTPQIAPPQFTFWRVSICILEAEIVLGVLYRKGGTLKKVGTLGFPQLSCVIILVSMVWPHGGAQRGWQFYLTMRGSPDLSAKHLESETRWWPAAPHIQGKNMNKNLDKMWPQMLQNKANSTVLGPCFVHKNLDKLWPQSAPKEGKLDSFGAIFLSIVLPWRWQ